MDQELLVRQIMQEVMKNMQGSAAACECESKVTVEDYPLGEKKPELIKSASGKSLNDLTLHPGMLYFNRLNIYSYSVL